MVPNLQPYPENRVSGLPWLKPIPSHWTVRRIKTVLRETDCRSCDGSGTLLSLTRIRGLIPHKEMTDKIHSAKTLVGYKRYHPGQIVMNRMQAWSGMFGSGSVEGLVSPDYAVFEILSGHSVELILERLKTPDLISQFALESRGIGSGFNRLYTDRLGPIPISLPPLDEQVTIIRFLAAMDHQFNRLIRSKRRMVELLNEQKQAVIHRAVTRGLDHSGRTKPSGISWVNEIASGWDALRSKYLFREVDARSATGQETRLSMSQKWGLVPSSRIEERRLMSESAVGAKICEKGDLVLNRLKAHLGVFALAPERGLVSPDYTVFRPIRPMQPRYFELVYRTPACRVELRKRAKGIVQGFWRLYKDDFYDIRVPVPPLPEQEEIVAHLDAELHTTNTAIDREIELIREYRARLVADVVTGQLDVREAMAQLPAEATDSVQPESAPGGEDSKVETELETDDPESE